MLYLRKVSLAKWTKSNYSETGKISADAITGCIRTSEETLSLWQIHDRENLNDTAILALISGLQSIDKVDFVILDGDELSAIKVPLENNTGHTPVVELINTHTDIVSLDYVSLGVVAHYIAHRLQNKTNIIQLIKDDVKDILKKAVDTSKLDINKVHPKLKEKILAIK